MYSTGKSTKILVSLIDLKEIISDENSYQTLIEGFECKKNLDLERFLKATSSDFEKRNLSRTYFILDIDDLNSGNLILYGYISLAKKTLGIPEDISNRQLRKKLGIIPNNEHHYMPCYLIGQFGKNDNFNGKITGDEMMELALEKIKEAQDIVGGRAILLDVDKNTSKVIEFYEKHKFQHVMTEPEDDEQCIQMIRYI